jgi:hypothetical protein
LPIDLNNLNNITVNWKVENPPSTSHLIDYKSVIDDTSHMDHLNADKMTAVSGLSKIGGRKIILLVSVSSNIDR